MSDEKLRVPSSWSPYKTDKQSQQQVLDKGHKLHPYLEGNQNKTISRVSKQVRHLCWFHWQGLLFYHKNNREEDDLCTLYIVGQGYEGVSLSWQEGS